MSSLYTCHVTVAWQIARFFTNYAKLFCNLHGRGEVTAKEDFQRALIEGVRSSGKNQSQIAREIGVTPQTVSKWVRDGSIPQTQLIQPLARILGIDETEFVEKFLAALADGAGRPSLQALQERSADPVAEIQEIRSVVSDLKRRIELIEQHLKLS